METREMTCINCPLGCLLTVTKDNGKVTVTGNTCPRGEDYGIKEMTDPRRTVTSTVRVKNGSAVKVPVKTKTDIPKDKIFEVMDVIRKAEVKPPVHIGDIIVDDIAGTGVPLVATKDVE
jgi:CxxC motif-containing protein